MRWRTTRRMFTGAGIGVCLQMRRFQLSLTIVPPHGQPGMGYMGGLSRARARMLIGAYSFLLLATATTRATAALARTGTTGPRRRIRNIRAERGTSTSIRATSTGATTSATTGSLSVQFEDLPNSARIARVFRFFNSLAPRVCVGLWFYFHRGALCWVLHKEMHTPVATASRLAFGAGNMSRCVQVCFHLTRQDAASPWGVSRPRWSVVQNRSE